MNKYKALSYDPQPFGYREAVTSEKLNNVFDTIRTSLLRTMLRSQLTRERVQELTLAQLYGNQLQVIQTESVRAEIDAARQHGNANTMHVSFYRHPDSDVPADVGINRDLVYGQISLSESSHWSKVPVYTNAFGDSVVSDNVTVYKDNEALDHRHSFYWTLNQMNDRFWLDNTAGKDEETIIRIVTPRGIKGEVNSIGVVPFPIGSCRITALEYLGNSGYVTVPGFVPTQNPVRTHFVPAMFNDEVRITLTANNLTSGGGTESLWGLSAIDIALVDYETTGTAYAKVSIPLGADPSSFTRITSVDADYYLDTNIPLSSYTTPPVIFKILTTGGEVIYNSSVNPYPMTNVHAPLTVTGSPTDLMVQVDLREPVNGISPVVKGVTFTYE
jgi:hypothetical protein